MAKFDEISAKVAPIVDKAKAEATPAWHSLRYVLVWAAWVITLPVVLAADFLGAFSKKIKPELPPRA